MGMESKNYHVRPAFETWKRGQTTPILSVCPPPPFDSGFWSYLSHSARGHINGLWEGGREVARRSTSDGSLFFTVPDRPLLLCSLCVCTPSARPHLIVCAVNNFLSVTPKMTLLSRSPGLVHCSLLVARAFSRPRGRAYHSLVCAPN